MKLMNLRHAGDCVACGVRIEERSQAWYDPSVKKVSCTSCRPVDTQLTVDATPSPAALAAPPMRPARTDLEKGTELEQKIAAVFAAHGYRVQTNVVREGRGGTSHEIDVIAEKTDDLLTLTVLTEPPFTSDLTRTELLRAVRRLDPTLATAARAVLDVCVIVGLPTTTFERAALPEPAGLRSLDALHLAAALTGGDELGSVITYDDRLAVAAEALGIMTVAPGA